MREPRPCSSWGQVAHVLTPDNFRLSLGQKDFAAPQGLPSRSRGMTRCAAMPTVRCRRLTIITGTTADRSAHAIKPVSSPRGMQRRPRRPRNLHPARDRGDGGHRARAGRRAIRLRRASDRDRLVLRAADTCAADESSPYGQSDITQFGAPPQKFINFPDFGQDGEGLLADCLAVWRTGPRESTCFLPRGCR